MSLDAAVFLAGASAAAAYKVLRAKALPRAAPSAAAAAAPPPACAAPSRIVLPSAGPGEINIQPIDSLFQLFPDAPRFTSPLANRSWPLNRNFVSPGDYTLGTQPFSLGASAASPSASSAAPAAYATAGPCPSLFFDPSTVRIAIATCGGLCPGLNTVIREVVMCATYTYGVARGAVLGVPNGYRGFYESPCRWRPLLPEDVSRAHLEGGTLLGSSRGGMDAERILDGLLRERIGIVVLIGGDGTHRGAAALCAAARARGARLSVACVPKTVDCDLPIIDRSFGFQTAVEQAVRPIDCAHTEAHSATQGVGLVKLMGRSAGHLAMHASLASRDVNVCLLPEVPWRLARLCAFLEARLAHSNHAVIVVAEGAESLERAAERAAEAAGAGGAHARKTDESGNPVLEDVGEYVRAGVLAHFKRTGGVVNLKYIDPSYVIRAAPANAADNDLCAELAFNCVHGAMAGLTAFTCGTVDDAGVWLPVHLMAGEPRRVDVSSRIFARLISSTGQPALD